MKSSFSELEAVGFAVAGFTFWVLADSTIKMVGSSRLPAYEVLAFLGLSVVVCMVLYGLWRGQVKQLWPRNPRQQLVRACFDLGNNFGVVVALRHLPLTLFYVLVFLAPMVITLLEALVLRERLEWRKSAAIALGFVGVVIAVNPFGAKHAGDWKGYAACGLCVACFSASMVWSRALTQTERSESLTFFSGMVLSVAGFLLMLGHAEPLTPRLSAVLAAMGVFCVLGSLCYFVALRHTSAASVSQYHYTQLLSGALIAWWIWGERPTLALLLGGGLILLSGLWMAVLASRGGRHSVPPFSALPGEQRSR